MHPVENWPCVPTISIKHAACFSIAYLHIAHGNYRSGCGSVETALHLANYPVCAVFLDSPHQVRDRPSSTRPGSSRWWATSWCRSRDTHAPADVSWFFFSLGLFFWPVLTAILFYRLIFHGSLPERFMPLCFIFIAPPAVGSFPGSISPEGWTHSPRVLYLCGPVLHPPVAEPVQLFPPSQVLPLLVGVFLPHWPPSPSPRSSWPRLPGLRSTPGLPPDC